MEKVILKEKLNYTTSLGCLRHPLFDDTINSQMSLREQEGAIFNHLQNLEDQYPNVIGFKYEKVIDSFCGYYNLVAYKDEMTLDCGETSIKVKLK